MNTNIDIIKNICKYCLVNFEISNSSRLMASLVHQLSRELDIDVPAVEGLMYLDIHGSRRPFAHCFNLFNSNIVDSTIYSYALMNKSLEDLFPLFITGTPPEHLDYVVQREIKYEKQHKFKKEFLVSILSELPKYSNVEIKRFNEYEDGKKKNIFWC
ncbi:MAG: hypothetical protein ACM3X7_09365 [Solirubrobacterales bacterium]